MEIRKAHRAGLAVLAALGLLAAGYGTASAGTGPKPAEAGGLGAGAGPQEEGPAAPDDDFQSTLELSDGRKVHVRLVEGTGAQERHTTAGSEKWSEWQTLYETESDRCQGVDLQEKDGTVSLIADFGRFCYDGEPPTESLAGVGTEDLTDWDIDVAEDFDGWEDSSITGEGSKVLFVYNSDFGLYTMRWTRGEGFSEIVETEGQ
ncbi:hypothetical protein [Streptomyces sp. WMMB 714]|uniref:hypothetical protein n=1 Tax=Streptomyces sp. WMMB 714 TaxID=1286822 RepID=UPI000698DC68|nr:hypothetical protein [Streptomyces sp. WMMB 714]